MWTVSFEKKEIKSIEVFDLLGRQMLFVEPNSQSANIDASNFKQGTYFAKIATRSGSRFVQLIKA